MEKGEWLGMKEMTMKAIMISIKPKWCAKIMNGEKTIEVRKNKALANAIQKLIDENGYADKLSEFKRKEAPQNFCYVESPRQIEH